jgi:hypothetical protein
LKADYVLKRPKATNAGAAEGHKKIKNQKVKIKDVEPLRGEILSLVARRS